MKPAARGFRSAHFSAGQARLLRTLLPPPSTSTTSGKKTDSISISPSSSTLTILAITSVGGNNIQVARKRIRRKPGNRVKISLQHPSSSSSTSSPNFKQQQQSNQSAANLVSLEGQSSKRNRSSGARGWQRQRQRLYDLWPSVFLASTQHQQRQGQQRISKSSETSNAACCSPAELNDADRLQQQAESTNNAGSGQTTSVGSHQESEASTMIAAGRPTNCQCLCHLPQQKQTPTGCCPAQPTGPVVGGPTEAATTTEQLESRPTAVETFRYHAPAGGDARDLVGVAAREATSSKLATAASSSQQQRKSSLQENGRRCESTSTCGDKQEKLKLLGDCGGDYHEIGFERRRTGSGWTKSSADNQIFDSSHSDAAGGSSPKRGQLDQSTSAPAQAQAVEAPRGALATGVGDDYNMGAGQSDATIQTKGSNQRNLDGSVQESKGSSAPLEPDQLQSSSGVWRPVGAHDFRSAFDNDRSPLQLDSASPGALTAAASVQTTATTTKSSSNHHEGKTRPVDHDGNDDDYETNSNSNAKAALGPAPREEASEAPMAVPGSTCAAANPDGGRSNGCPKCRRCHWARHRSATQIGGGGGGSELNWRQTVGGGASSFSSEMQSSMASYSRTSSLANCALDFSSEHCGGAFGQVAAGSQNELPLGCSTRPQPTMVSSTNGCESSANQQLFQRHQRAQQQQRYSSGAIGLTGNNGEFTEVILPDECCGCCCNSQSHSGTAIAEADDNDDDMDIVDMDMDDDMIGLDASSDRLSRVGGGGLGGNAGRRRSSATSCSNSSSKLPLQHRRHQQQRLADSRVSLDERGLPLSELAAPPAADSRLTESRTHQEREDQRLQRAGEGHQPPDHQAAFINLACEPEANIKDIGANDNKLDYDQELSQQTQRDSNNRRPSRVANLLALIRAAPVALCWRSLRAQLNKRSKNPFMPAAESSAACEVGLLQAAACNVNNMNTILIDENGKSSLIRGANSGNGSATIITCKICQCVRGVVNRDSADSGLPVQKQTSSACDTGKLLRQPAPPPSPPPLPSSPPITSTSINVMGASGSHEQTRTRAAGMVIAASTANIAVTTARPPFASSNSVQYQASTLAAAAATEGLESKRERKAAKTLAIITGVFVMCWLPFFVMALSMPLLNVTPHKYLMALLVWLGYANSMLNPIIYTIFSPDFRKAFKRLLCGLETEAERRRRGATKQALHLTRSSHNTNNNNYCNNTDIQQSSCYNSCSTTTAIDASTSPFARHIHPLLTRCCLPSFERAMMSSSSTRTTTTIANIANSNNKNINSENSERKKTEQATTFDKEVGGLLANSNYLNNQGQLIRFPDSPNKQQQEPNSIQLGGSRRYGELQATSGSQQGTVNTTGRPLSSIKNNF